MNDALECVTTFKQKNPISSKEYENVKKCLFERFHGSETRTQYFTEFQNCTRLSGETITDFACRLQKLFLHAYPIPKGGLSVETAAVSEKMLMDKFLSGLPRNLQRQLKHKEYPSFEILIKKTEARAACDEDYIDENPTHINAVIPFPLRPTTPPAPNHEMRGVLDAVNKLCSSVERNLSIQTEELQRNLRQAKNRNPSQRVWFEKPNNKENLFCEFHNTYGNHTTLNCWVREKQLNYTCQECGKRGHNYNFCPNYRLPRPNPPQDQHERRPTAQSDQSRSEN
jgi:hypothetical protein